MTAETADCPSLGALNFRLLDFTLHGNTRGVTECLRMGANPNAICHDPPSVYNGASALHIAAGNGDEKIVSLLLATGANPDDVYGSGATPLFLAVSHKRSTSLALALLEAGAKPGTGHDAQGRTALHYAVTHDSLPLVNALLEHKADVHARTQMEFWTPLHYAAYNECDAIILRLLDAGASPHMVDFEGATPLHYAASRKFEKTCEILLEGGASMDTPAQNGETPAGIWDRVAEIAAGVSERQRARIIAENRVRMKKLGALQQRGPRL